MRILFAVAASLLVVTAVMAPPGQAQEKSGTDAAAEISPAARAAVEVVDAFHGALRRGDTNAALTYLDPNALIFEAGGVERSREEYASHHLGADAEFAKAVPATVTRRAAEAVGDFAWITVLAHEWGHHVQLVMGTTQEQTIDRELQADCFAGSYAQRALQQGFLQEGDLTEAMVISILSADPVEMAESVEGAHGSGDYRVTAFMNGYFNGFSACLGS